jgi:nitrous oxidase accessory protein
VTRRSRILVLISAIALAASFLAPLWRIDLEAPQYPEGLGMRIWAGSITGAGEWDLKKINQLNHYIGMKVIEPDSIAELDVMPWVIVVLALGGLATAAVGRRRLLYVWVAVFGLAAAAGLVDFWMWEYDYGHDLNPEAAIKIPGMSYQPPLIGSKQILNFKANSWPGAGGWAAIGAFGLAALAAFLELRGRGRGRPARVGGPVEDNPEGSVGSGPDGGVEGRTDGPSDGAARASPPHGRPARTGPGAGVAVLVLAGALGTAGCGEPAPSPIAFGEDRGEHCGMTIADERYGAELVTVRGKVHKFDSVECLAGFRLAMEDSGEIHSMWVTDFSAPPTLIRVEDAFFLESRDLRSPMGANLTAFGPGMTRQAALHSFFGRILEWDEVLTLVGERGGPGAGGAGGHTGTLAPDARAEGHAAGDMEAPTPGSRDGRAPDGATHVSPDGPVRTLAAAVAAAEPGSRIVVEPGVYREPTVVVDRPLEIVGVDGPVLDGEGSRQLMIIEADGVTVRGMVFRNVGTSYVEDRSAIRVEEARGCRIESNRFEDTFFGVYLASAAGCVVADNVMRARESRETAAGNGIHAWYSKDVEVRGNDIRGHRDGIYFEFVEGSDVRGNRVEGNLRYGLHFMFSDDCRYVGNAFRENGAGVAVMYTEGVEMRGNLFERNWGTAAFGLLLKDIARSRIEDNAFVGNSVGIYAEGMNGVTVRRNEFQENGWAVRIMANSLDNVFTANDFLGNTFDVSTNSRQSFSEFRGNYWDEYRGYDLDRDGVGDVPFRPVRLFSLVVERNEPSLVLLRSLLVTTLDAAERVFPALTPETLVDASPRMRRAT